jgi:tetratricopeptide (TPR) repeat protein
MTRRRMSLPQSSILLLLLLGIASALEGAAAAPTDQAAPPSEPVPARMHRLLKTRAFGELAGELEARQKAFEASVGEEDALWQAFHAFFFSDPELLAPLDEWIKLQPKSGVARVARGLYLQGCAGTARGAKWIQDTSPKQVDDMTRYLRRAEADFRAALSIDGHLVVAEEGLMMIGKMLGDRAMVDVAFQAALRVKPESFIIRAACIATLEPRWGGSYAEMKAVADQGQMIAGKNPRLRALAGYPTLDKANDAVREKDIPRAIKLLSDAIASGPADGGLLAARGALLLKEKRYADALNDLDRALSLQPHGWWHASVRYSEALLYQGQCLYFLGRKSEAVKSVATASAIDPLNPQTREWVAFLDKTSKDAH